MTKTTGALTLAASLLALSACSEPAEEVTIEEDATVQERTQGTPEDPMPEEMQMAQGSDCSDADIIGRFDPATDLYIGNFDIKTDVDDLHAAAALGTILKSDGYECVDYLALHGTYGEQEGDFLPAPGLFDMAFGDNWLDADQSRDETVETVAGRVIETLSAGGDVWIQEAGQSDVSAAFIRAAMQDAPDLPYSSNVHIVQHADWNEDVTNDEALAFVKAEIDYIRIEDGNEEGNGTPGFKNDSAEYWPALTGDPVAGPLWAEAKRMGEELNPPPGYVNPAVEKGGIDFSDTVEAAYIFGFDDMENVAGFVDRFIEE